MLTLADRAKSITERRVRLATAQEFSDDIDGLTVQLRDSITLAFQYRGLSKLGLDIVKKHVPKGEKISPQTQSFISGIEDLLLEDVPPLKLQGNIFSLEMGL
ncbi:hypothetical protein C9422_18750 [Pseudomonas sp. B1(2018)]|uniref:hypothetical protein n=1 Tax=Pseudomonas sp. B1(2018) TaxID=2233856 RepID=UPI000D5E288B|nr:hypothetical protein [Pseudomonas sp. B1(2018)]PVZ56562.1 hypothetical protein C9422_18750 [Pseudomonas sp. B1(2018)]